MPQASPMIKFLIKFLPLLLLSFGARAEEGKGAEIFSLKIVEEMINSVFGKSTVDVFVAGALSIASRLNSMAMGLAGILALISILWGLLFAILEKKSVFSSVMETLVFCVLTVLLLGNYQLIIQDVVNLGQKTIEASGGSVGEAFTGFIKTFVSAFVKLFDAAISNFEGSWSFLTIAMEVIVSLIFLVIAAIFVFVSLVELVAVFLMGPVGLGIGVAIGPLFIATLPWNETRSWIKKWLDFIIVSSMITALAVIVMVLIQNVLVETVKAIGAPGESGASVGRVIAFALICASLSKIFGNIPAFADALFPGRSGVPSSKGEAAKSGVNAAKAAVAGAAGSVGAYAIGKAQQGAAAAAGAFNSGRAAGKTDGGGAQNQSRQQIQQVANSSGGSGGGSGGSGGSPGGGFGGSGGGSPGSNPGGGSGGSGGNPNGSSGGSSGNLGGGSGNPGGSSGGSGSVPGGGFGGNSGGSLGGSGGSPGSGSSASSVGGASGGYGSGSAGSGTTNRSGFDRASGEGKFAAQGFESGSNPGGGGIDRSSFDKSAFDNSQSSSGGNSGSFTEGNRGFASGQSAQGKNARSQNKESTGGRNQSGQNTSSGSSSDFSYNKNQQNNIKKVSDVNGSKDQ